jgi:phenylalanyl-tRNA synthetase alpha chain
MTADPLAEALGRLEQVRVEALAAIEGAASTHELETVRVRFAGRKSAISEVLQIMGSLDADGRKTLGAARNGVARDIDAALAARAVQLAAIELDARLEAERLDVTLPGTVYRRGYRQPLLETLRVMLDVFRQMGYAIHEGPEVELDLYNFEMLNIPKNHPARDLQDTFYVSQDMVMRTQTSPAQIRIMQASTGPIRVVVPGTVYRNEAEDASHGDQFYQIEGLAVDRNITMGDLKGTLTELVGRLFGADRRLRFRPWHFPFTEPSAEIDIECSVCHGTGCRSCGNEGWLELGGSGMVHPNVLRNGGYDPEEWSGFAFGIGPDRFTMMKYNIPDLRLLRDNDLRFLRQFN